MFAGGGRLLVLLVEVEIGGMVAAVVVGVGSGPREGTCISGSRRRHCAFACAAMEVSGELSKSNGMTPGPREFRNRTGPGQESRRSGGKNQLQCTGAWKKQPDLTQRTPQ